MLGSGDFGDKSPSQTCDYWYKLAFQKCIGLALLRTKNSYGTDFNNSSVYVWQNNTASKWYRSASIFLRLTKVWSILHHGSVGGVQKKKMLFCLFIFLFHHKICVFIFFISVFDEVSNLCGRISANQKLVQNCQWNSMIQTILSAS